MKYKAQINGYLCQVSETKAKLFPPSEWEGRDGGGGGLISQQRMPGLINRTWVIDRREGMSRPKQIPSDNTGTNGSSGRDRHRAHKGEIL